MALTPVKPLLLAPTGINHHMRILWNRGRKFFQLPEHHPSSIIIYVASIVLYHLPFLFCFSVDKRKLKSQKRIEQDEEISAVVETEQESAPPQDESPDEAAQLEKPKFAKKLEDVEVVEGSAARFEVIVDGKEINWS